MGKNNEYVYISIREKPWVDLQDNKYLYKKGDIYPREGLEVTKERLKELSSNKNRLGEVLIQKTKIESKDTTEETEAQNDENTTTEETENQSDKNTTTTEEED